LTEKALGALMNLSIEDTFLELVWTADFSVPTTILVKDLVFSLLPSSKGFPGSKAALHERAAGVVSRISRHSSAKDALVSAGAIEALLSLVKQDNQLLWEHVARSLANLGVRGGPNILKFRCDEGSGAALLAQLLAKTRNNQICGNAALCVAACALDQSAAPALRGTIPSLVEVMAKGNDSAKKNAAIACARLARDPQCLQQLRTLRGIEMMASIS
jgi:hypothetical protein